MARGVEEPGEPRPLDLARASFGDLVDDQHLPRHLERREALAREDPQLRSGRDRAVAQHDGDRDVLAQRRMGYRERRGLHDLAVREQGLIDLAAASPSPRRD